MESGQDLVDRVREVKQEIKGLVLEVPQDHDQLCKVDSGAGALYRARR